MERTAQLYGEQTELRWAGTEWIEEYIGKYAEIYDNLVLHDPGYPSPDELLSLIRIGNITFEGEMAEETEGSNFIKDILLDDNPEPVYLQAWGGTNTIARALKSIEETYKDTPEWADIYASVSAKSVIYIILDQDATYRNYIEPHWPDLQTLYNSSQFGTFAYNWNRVLDPLKEYLRGPWFAEHIKFDHGPLVAEES